MSSPVLTRKCLRWTPFKPICPGWMESCAFATKTRSCNSSTSKTPLTMMMSMMMMHNPPRRGTRSWSTPDPVSRGRRYSYSCRKKNEKGVFNKKSQSFSPRKRETREREKEKKKKYQERERIGTIQSYTHSCVVSASSKSLTEEEFDDREEKKKRNPPKTRTPLLLLPPHLARAVHHSEGRRPVAAFGPPSRGL